MLNCCFAVESLDVWYQCSTVVFCGRVTRCVVPVFNCGVFAVELLDVKVPVFNCGVFAVELLDVWYQCSTVVFLL